MQEGYRKQSQNQNKLHQKNQSTDYTQAKTTMVLAINLISVQGMGRCAGDWLEINHF